MTNYICPACNNIFEKSYKTVSEYMADRYYHDIYNSCKIILYVQNNIDFCIDDGYGFYMKYNLFYGENSHIIIEYDTQTYELGYQITNYIEAYKTLVKFKENMLFL